MASVAAETNARHSMDSAEWYTPLPFIEAARNVIGQIDLDPASHWEANLNVKALTFYSQEDDGLSKAWYGRVFLNPPGGLVPDFWQKLLTDWEKGRTTEAVWIGYSLEQLQTLQTSEFRSPIEFSICIPNRRIAFIENEAKRAQRHAKLIAAGKKPNQKSSPSHANYITYLGQNQIAFEREFSRFGTVVLR